VEGCGQLVVFEGGDEELQEGEFDVARELLNVLRFQWF